MLPELLGNDIMKENLLKVVTIFGPAKDSSKPEQGELYFRNNPISERYVSAWQIIGKVYDKVKGKKLTISAFLLELEKGSKESWWSELFSTLLALLK